MKTEINNITIHVESMCRTDILGDIITLRSTEELDNAILVINKACSDEVQRRANRGQEEFEANIYHKIKQAQEE